MADQDLGSQEGASGGAAQAAGEAADADYAPNLRRVDDFPSQSPLFHAEHQARYERQRFISNYEGTFGCRLVVMFDGVFSDSLTFFEELVYDADPSEDLHLILASPGGDGEAAVRLVRSAQARCRELTVIVPDQAKSAATLLALGAHRVLMGPTSDLGPVDPQLVFGDRQAVSAKDLISAVEHAEQAIAEKPDTFPLHASMLADVTEVMLQQARSALARTEDLVEEALRSNPDRDEEKVAELKESLQKPLVDAPKQHGAIFGAHDAEQAGLPVEHVDPATDQWKMVWMLWARYVMIGPAVYEGRRASRIVKNPQVSTQP